MLLLTKTHFIKRGADGVFNLVKKDIPVEAFSRMTPSSPQTVISHFIPAAQKIEQFTSGKEAKASDKIVYIDGAFDLFHPGHIAFIREAKKLGTYLIVGVYDDQTVNQYQGKNLPIMNVYERVLGTLSCRYVDEVVIGAPLHITKDFIDSLRINEVVCGSVAHSYTEGGQDSDNDLYRVPKDLGILKVVSSPSKLTTPEVIKRILENHALFEERNKKKENKEINATGKTFTTKTKNPSTT